MKHCQLLWRYSNCNLQKQWTGTKQDWFSFYNQTIVGILQWRMGKWHRSVKSRSFGRSATWIGENFGTRRRFISSHLWRKKKKINAIKMHSTTDLKFMTNTTNFTSGSQCRGRLEEEKKNEIRWCLFFFSFTLSNDEWNRIGTCTKSSPMVGSPQVLMSNCIIRTCRIAALRRSDTPPRMVRVWAYETTPPNKPTAELTFWSWVVG